MTTQNQQFKISELSPLEISDFFKEHDDDYFEKLSDRVDIEEYSEKLFENSVKFTIWNNIGLIGLSPCYFNNAEEKIGYISSLTIKKGFRGQSLGSKMLKQIALYAKRQGFNKVMVKIHFSNEVSRKFYHKNGFTDFIADEENDFRLLRLDVS